MSHTHEVLDTDARYVIDPVTRSVKGEKTVVVQYDHNSERITFEMPRYYEGHDMSACDVVQIHFLNASSTGKARCSGIYVVDDIAVSSDEEKVSFSWLISSEATQLAGPLSFTVRFECASDSGSLGYAWNTETCSAISVSAGMYFGE